MRGGTTKLFFLIIIVVLIRGMHVWAGEPSEKSSQMGIIAGFGTGPSSEGTYHPILVALHFSFKIAHPVPYGTFSIVLEPQVNPAFSPHREIEGGLAIGFKYAYQLSNHLFPYLMGTFGPHYITFRSEDQENGFLFSSTLEAGLAFKLPRDNQLQIGYRFRHLSNGGLKVPNGGLNTHFFTVGYAFLF